MIITHLLERSPIHIHGGCCTTPIHTPCQYSSLCCCKSTQLSNLHQSPRKGVSGHGYQTTPLHSSLHTAFGITAAAANGEPSCNHRTRAWCSCMAWCCCAVDALALPPARCASNNCRSFSMRAHGCHDDAPSTVEGGGADVTPPWRVETDESPHTPCAANADADAGADGGGAATDGHGARTPQPRGEDREWPPVAALTHAVGLVLPRFARSTICVGHEHHARRL